MRRVCPRLLLLAALKLAAASYVLLGVYVGYRTTEGFSRPPRRARVHPPSWVSATATDVRIRSADGLDLGATYQPPAPGRPVLVMAHGIGNSREQWLPIARMLAEAGYGFLAFDWRAHGESEGERGTFGQHEGEDLGAVQAWLASHGDPPLAVLGSSMGGGIVASWAPRLGPRVKAVVLDSAYASLPRMVEHHTARLGPLAWVARPVIQLVCWARGVRLDRVARLEALRPRPLLVMHTTPDTVVPAREGHALFDGYAGPKRAWFSDAGGHLGARVKEWPRWIRTVAMFLEEHVPGAPPAAAVLQSAPAAFSGLFAPVQTESAGARGRAPNP